MTLQQQQQALNQSLQQEALVGWLRSQTLSW